MKKKTKIFFFYLLLDLGFWEAFLGVTVEVVGGRWEMEKAVLGSTLCLFCGGCCGKKSPRTERGEMGIFCGLIVCIFWPNGSFCEPCLGANGLNISCKSSMFSLLLASCRSGNLAECSFSWTRKGGEVIGLFHIGWLGVAERVDFPAAAAAVQLLTTA